jgi:hypothetical protein
VNAPEPILIRGDFHPRVEKRGEFAVLTTASGTVMLDDKAIELLAMARGLVLRRPSACGCSALPVIDVEPRK